MSPPGLNNETVLWKLMDGPRTARAVARPHYQGRELRITAGGQLLLVRVYTPTCRPTLNETAEGFRFDLVRAGWTHDD